LRGYEEEKTGVKGCREELPKAYAKKKGRREIAFEMQVSAEKTKD